MIRIILCEGETDAILLSYYLERAKKWKYNSSPKEFNIKLNKKGNQSVNHYLLNNEELAICAVGGKDNFIPFYREYIQPYIAVSENENREYKIAFVTDRDDREIIEIEKGFSDNLNSYISKVLNGKWVNNNFIDSFGQEASIKVLLLIIPEDKQGALETLLLDALSEDEYKGNLIEKSKNFIDAIVPEADKIISSERLKLKSKLGVSLAVLYPEKVFSLIDEQLKSIDWESFEKIKECFRELIKI